MKETVKLGQLLGSAEQRDAVHVAVLPCRCDDGMRLMPGQHVGILRIDSSTKDPVVGPVSDKHIGIVDPFLFQYVWDKMRFYVLLYPNTIESLRHEWRHKIIDGEAK